MCTDVVAAYSVSYTLLSLCGGACSAAARPTLLNVLDDRVRHLFLASSGKEQQVVVVSPVMGGVADGHPGRRNEQGLVEANAQMERSAEGQGLEYAQVSTGVPFGQRLHDRMHNSGLEHDNAVLLLHPLAGRGMHITQDLVIVLDTGAQQLLQVHLTGKVEHAIRLSALDVNLAPGDGIDEVEVAAGLEDIQILVVVENATADSVHFKNTLSIFLLHEINRHSQPA